MARTNKLRNKVNVFLAFFLAVATSLCFVNLASADESLPDPPDHHKTISQNTDGSYTVTLTVKGAEISSTETQGKSVDVIIVFDQSGSMLDQSSGRRRDAVAIEAANNFVNTLFQSQDVDAQFAFVGFNTGSYTATNSSGGHWFTENEQSELNGIINNAYAVDFAGTNWESALNRANSLLDEVKDDGSDKYILFLSDGDPTFHVIRNEGDQTHQVCYLVYTDSEGVEHQVSKTVDDPTTYYSVDTFFPAM